MIKYIKSTLSAILVGLLFTVGTCLIFKDCFITGFIIYTIAYLSLDFYSYIDKKLGYPNNLFIKN